MRSYRRSLLGAAAAVTLLALIPGGCSKTADGQVDVGTVISDIRTLCSYETSAAIVLQIAAQIAAATGNSVVIGGTALTAAAATAIEHAVCNAVKAQMAANASLKSLAKGAKQSLVITVDKVEIDGKMVDIKPVEVDGVVTQSGAV